MIKMKHELVLLAQLIDWEGVDQPFGKYFSKNGRPGMLKVIHVSFLYFGIFDQEKEKLSSLSSSPLINKI